MTARRCKACFYGVTRAHVCFDKDAATGTAADGGGTSGSLSLLRHPSSGGGASASTQPVASPDRVTDGPHRSTFDDGWDAA